ncbi:MAG: DUF3791 domain-containing protein [Clostridiales bacterium]|nr:DUF3791 domain-containing protein [Clostridiales bacterium]
MNKNELDFAVFCIESVAKQLDISGSDVYGLLTINSKILDDYIIPCSDVLHTQGKEYIVSDIIEYMRREGVLQ